MTVFATRFSLGDTVHVFGRKTRTVFDPCDVCGGTGRVTFTKPSGETADTYCPERSCRSGKVRSIAFGQWEYGGTARIGQIRVKSTSPSCLAFADDSVYEEDYMLDRTGIGSGTVYTFVPEKGWTHTHLFATEEEGRAWAEPLNQAARDEATRELEEARP